MPVEFVGGTVSFTTTEIKRLTLSFSRDAEIREIMMNADQRTEITSFRIFGVEEYITGAIELDLLKEYGNVYILPEPISYPREAKIQVSLNNYKGGSNTVYVGLVMVY